ncbi:MAG: Na+/H+ antiporter NhaA [Acidimicrobiales bacterium]|nr:Na+/H+ antiporter NhaA [Acidimicrobiales bacterium]
MGRPMQRFLGIEAAGGVLLMVATVVAMVWANSPWSSSYTDLWNTEINLSLGNLLTLEHQGHPLTLSQFVNDVLMVIFFFVVGLEIKRELVMGELREFRAALLPAAAALGGMVVPALVYFALNSSGDASAGWGIPMATDIAFAVGVLSLLGPRIPTSLKIFLLTLAIVDDIGAILVIAIFYTEKLAAEWLLLAFAVAVVVRLLTKARVWYTPIYAVLGTVMWYAIFESGVHATIAGVVMGLLAPAKPLIEEDHHVVAFQRSGVTDVDAHSLRRMAFEISETVPVTERLENLLHPLTGFIILPLFALANAGIILSVDSITAAASSGITLGVSLGLVVGKIIGVSVFTLLAVRFGLCSLPAGASSRHVVGIAAMAGIGFTVSLFITGLAFSDPVLQDEAKIGILVASLVAALLGAFILRGARPMVEPVMPRENEGI